MHLKLIFCFFFLACSNFFVNTFDNCNGTPFCNNLRYREPEDKYTVVADSVTLDDATATATMTLTPNDGSGDLTLTISCLEGSTFHTKITQNDLSRYEIVEALDGVPVVKSWDSAETAADSLTITTDSGANSVKVVFSPFNIEFSKDGVLEITFNGNRLYFDTTEGSTAFTWGASFPAATQIYGIPEHAERMPLQNTVGNNDPYRMRNLDTYGYPAFVTSSIYGAIPVIWGHSAQATAGIFFQNAAQQWWDITNGEGQSQMYVITEAAALDYFMMLGPKPVDIVRQFTTLVGKAHLPQFWTLGYHQSRYSYMSQDEVREIVTNFDANNFQMDAIWLDIDYTDGMRYFTWNPETFSDPVGLQDFVASTNRKMITIIDPHVKVEPGYGVYDGALAQGFFALNPDGSVYEGNCWPGQSAWVDFLNPDARTYYASLYSYANFPGSTPTIGGIWNDMNEPAVFSGPEQTMPSESTHFGGVTHREVHNLYGMLNAMATHQGLLERDNGEKRPFVLTRAHFAGAQRYAATWTGDNKAEWPYMYLTFPMAINSNLAGMVFVGTDIGGFVGNPNEELLQRWYQTSAWVPFFRAHSAKDTSHREPYLFSAEVQNVIRNTIQLRYKHLPVWYTLFYEHTRTGDPIVRPIFYQYPEDTNAFSIDDQILTGRDIMARVITDGGIQTIGVYFPGGAEEMWLAEKDNSVFNGNGYVDVPVDISTIPIFYRRGSVIVRKETVRPSTVGMAGDGHTLFVSLAADNTAHGTVYLDDLESFKYRDNKEYNYLSIDFTGTDFTTTKIDADSVSDAFPFVVDEVIFKNVTRAPQNGQPGEYETIVFTHDASGTPLKDLKLGLTRQTTVKLF